MKKVVLIAVLLVILSGSNLLYSQQVSARRAMLYSALIPGMGEMYLGEQSRAGIFLGAEFLIVASYLRINREVGWKTNSYKLHAHNYADVPMNLDDDYYRLINNYISSEAYNLEIEQFLRNRYIIFEYRPDLYEYYRDLYLIGDEEAWEWENRTVFLEYRAIRRDKQRLEILANFAIGAAVLNRVISVVDSALIARRINRESTILSNVRIKPDFIRKGYILSYEFSF